MSHTVDSLIRDLQELQSKGYGNKIVVVATDEEGNGYRELERQEILCEKNDIEEYLGDYDAGEHFYEGCSDVRVQTPPNSVVIL